MSRRFVAKSSALGILLSAAFAWGVSSARPSRAPRSRPIAASAQPGSFAGFAAPSIIRSTRVLTPPPIPKRSQAAINGGPPTEEQLRGSDEQVNNFVTERLGRDFPKEKRDRLAAARRFWIGAQLQAARAYYHGEITQQELTTAVHRNMLTMAQLEREALTADEYRRLYDLEPEMDPFLAIATPGRLAGEEGQPYDPSDAE